MQLFDDLKYDFKVIYEEQAAIGKRYTRQDLIGTPFCFTVDHQTLEDDTVTVRHRDSTYQERININQVDTWLEERVSMKAMLKKL